MLWIVEVYYNCVENETDKTYFMNESNATEYFVKMCRSRNKSLVISEDSLDDQIDKIIDDETVMKCGTKYCVEFGGKQYYAVDAVALKFVQYEDA